MSNHNPCQESVYSYWNNTVCCPREVKSQPLTRGYFEDIENYKYTQEPEIQTFAQFSRYHGKKVLEIGVGTGTDFLQWVRCGARAYGVDLTETAIEYTSQRLKMYGLQAEELRRADCENLPYPDDSFDLAYSWGVIHHTTNTEKALSEIVRVVRPGGGLKIMIYNRHSLVAYYRWWQKALMKGKLWKNLSWVLANHMESYGTKAFTYKEALEMFNRHPLKVETMQRFLTCYDKKVPFGPALARILGPETVGWFMGIHARKYH